MAQGNKPPWLKPYAMKDNPEPLGEQTITGISAPRAVPPAEKPVNIHASLLIRKGGNVSNVNLSNDQLTLSLGNSREESEIHIADPTISKRQLVIMRLVREFLIIDCGVNDMVRVDGIPSRQTVVPVGARALITMGSTAMVFTSEEDNAADVARPQYKAPRPGAYVDVDQLPVAELVINPESSAKVSTGNPILFGGAEQCDVVISDRDVLPYHAIMFWGPEGVSLMPLSNDGVAVNKANIEDVVVLKPEDKITICGRDVTFVLKGDWQARGEQLYPARDFQFRQFAFTSLNVQTLPSFTVPCEGEAMTLGRSPTCDISLDETSVSRVHAQVIPSGKSFYLIDNYSSNGTFVNDVKISKRRVRAGDIVEFGRNPFIVHYA